MIELDRLRTDVLAMYPTVLGEVGADLLPARREVLDHGRARLVAGRYFVVVCGEFRRGKSSLLNALVERTALFPVDSDLTTATVCTLQYGDEEQAVVYFVPAEPDDPDPDAEPDVEPPKVVPLAEVARYITEQADPDNKYTVARVEMSARIESLRSGLVLVDTPGVGSENAAHSAATRAFLPNADAILFVGSAPQPLGLVELNFLAHALDQCPVVVTALTKLDQVVAPGPVVAEARERIAKVAGVEPRDLVVVAVSAHRRAAALEETDPELAAELLEDSGFAALESALWTGLAATCGAAQLFAALDGLDAALADGRAPLDNELAALAGDGELARIDGELAEARDRIVQLGKGRSQWRDRLRHDIKSAARDVMDRFGADFDELREEFVDGANSDRALNDPQKLVRQASEAMVDAAQRANDDLSSLVDGIAERYSKETAVALTASGVRSGRPDIALGEAPAGVVRSGGGHTAFRRIWGGGVAGAGAGAGLGALVGSVVPVIGTAIGAVLGGIIGKIGGLFGGKREHERLEREKAERDARRNLRDHILPKIDKARRRTEKDLARQIEDATTSLTAALETQLGVAAESLQESAARLKDNRARTAAQLADRQRQLDAAQARFDALFGSLDALRGQVVDLARTHGIG